jgi:transcriptional regulator with XRE-family HTH domain
MPGRPTAAATKIDPDFGPWLRRTREGMRVSVKEFAERAGLNTGTITNFEKGHRLTGAFTVEVFEQLAMALEVDLAYMLFKAGYKLGPDGIDAARLKRMEVVAGDFAEHAPDLRLALANAIGEAERRDNKRLQLELGRGLAALDRMAERLSREGFTPGAGSAVEYESVERRPWLDADVAFLRENPKLSHQEAGRYLGRSATAVRIKRTTMNGDRP